MSVVNINRANTDAFYRYKMPRLQSKIEGKGNGIKTVIPNMDEIARCLGRPANYPTKFFGLELGAQTTMDEANNRYVVNGAHDERPLAELLDKFIKKFVLCSSCSNPETVIIVDKREEIWLDCKACGARNKVDQLQKLCVYILKNPPASAIKDSKSKSGGKEKKSKEERRREKNERAKNGGSSKRNSDDENNDDENDQQDEAPSAEGAPTTAAAGGESTDVSMIADVDEEFTVDEATLAKARKELTEGLNSAVKNLIVYKDDDAADGGDDAGDAYEGFAAFLATPRSADEITAKISSDKLKEDKALAVLVQTTFTENIITELPEKKDLLKKLVKSEKSVKGLIGGLERLVGATHKSLIPKFMRILKFLYDEDVLEEEVILAWNDKISKKYIDKETGAKLREVVKPFIDWLKTAEEEEEDDDDEEEEN